MQKRLTREMTSGDRCLNELSPSACLFLMHMGVPTLLRKGCFSE